jgi:RNA polymerase sigma-70 factor (ECF subfamily)
MAGSTKSAQGEIRGDARFPDTMWFMVKGAANHSSPQAQQALESLCRAYWEPIYAFIRRTGKSPHDTEDLTQRFFMHLLEDNRLQHAEPEKGRFRSFLQRSIKNFLVDDWRCKPSLERRSGGLLEIDAERGETCYRHEPTDNLDPEMIFERVWARKVMDLAMARLKSEYVLAGTTGLFDYLQSFLPDNTPICSRAEAAERLGMTGTALDVAFHRLKRRYKELLRKEIAETLERPAKQEVEDELTALMRVFGR